METTSIAYARALVDYAVARIPNLTTFGVGVYYKHYQQGPEDAATQVSQQQAELYGDHSLGMVAACADWIKIQRVRTTINTRCTSYAFKHAVEASRRASGDLDPYTHNGAFIAAAVGLGLDFRVAGPNAHFNLEGSHVQ